MFIENIDSLYLDTFLITRLQYACQVKRYVSRTSCEQRGLTYLFCIFKQTTIVTLSIFFVFQQPSRITSNDDTIILKRDESFLSIRHAK